jgi:hypothetical protein
MAIPAAEFPVNPDPLPHSDLPGELYIPVAQVRVSRMHEPCLNEKHTDTFPRYLFGCRVLGSHLHAVVTGNFCVHTISVMDIKNAAVNSKKKGRSGLLEHFIFKPAMPHFFQQKKACRK